MALTLLSVSEVPTFAVGVTVAPPLPLKARLDSVLVKAPMLSVPPPLINTLAVLVIWLVKVDVTVAPLLMTRLEPVGVPFPLVPAPAGIATTVVPLALAL